MISANDMERLKASMLEKSPPAMGASPVKKGTLAAVIGLAAAALVLVKTPEEESGRKVQVTMAQDGTATVQHVAGKQYLRSYLDIVGVPTACDGITKGVRLNQTYTEAQCAALLEAELVRHASGIMACSPGLRAPGRDWQRAGSTLLAYNIGIAGFCGSTARKRFDSGDIRGGCDAFLRWNKAGGREVAGLTKRRQRERAICLRGVA